MEEMRHGIRRIETSYGFVLLVPTPHGVDVEAYGMSGIGRYELFYACVGVLEGDVQDHLRAAAEQDNVGVYNDTKAALGHI